MQNLREHIKLLVTFRFSAFINSVTILPLQQQLESTSTDSYPIIGHDNSMRPVWQGISGPPANESS